MSHSFFAPSKGAMWMECYGSLAMPENQAEETSSIYADDGTASHTIAAWALDNEADCSDFPLAVQTINGREYPTDDERVGYVQSYVDDIRRSAIGGILWAEHRVDLSRYLGMAVCDVCHGAGEVDADVCPKCDGDGEVPQGGTGDAIAILPAKRTLIVSDLKYGVGERVYASYQHNGVRRINHQTGLYALGALEDVLLLGYDIRTIIVRIYQPRLNWIDEFTISASDLLYEFAPRVVAAANAAGAALVLPVDQLDAQKLLTPSDKACRWCLAKARCPALQRYVAEQTRADFDDESGEPLAIPESTEHLARAYRALPLIQQWVKATQSALWKAIANGQDVIGPDDKPLKLVEGKLGAKTWLPQKLLSGEVEGALVGVLGDKAYQPRKPITAPEAAKLLDKKATKATWKDVFEPLFSRAAGSLQIAWGSDERPAAGSRTASSDEFDSDEIGVE